MKTLILLVIALTLVYRLNGDPLDFQLRIPIHLQYTDLYTNRLGRLGFAVWNIFSDVTAVNNETASFMVAGPLLQYGKKGSWLEVMGGLKRNEDGYNDPAVDIRLFDQSIPKINIRAEVAFFSKEARSRFYSWIAMDTPVSFGKYRPLIGFESENIISYSGKRDSLGIGPRLVLPIPLGKLSSRVSSALTITYQHRNDQDFVRCYLGINLKLGGK